MDLFPNPQYKNTFLSGNTAKPIVGVCTNSAYKRPLKEAQVLKQMTAGTPITVVNKAGFKTQDGAVNAGSFLAPNVFTAGTANGTAIHGFLIDSPNFVLQEGDEGTSAQPNQIVYIALIGSGAEVYLPCDNTMVGYNGTNPIKYDKASGLLKGDGTGDIEIDCLVLSAVVDGLRFKLDGTKVVAEDVSVVKVKL